MTLGSPLSTSLTQPVSPEPPNPRSATNAHPSRREGGSCHRAAKHHTKVSQSAGAKAGPQGQVSDAEAFVAPEGRGKLPFFRKPRVCMQSREGRAPTEAGLQAEAQSEEKREVARLRGTETASHLGKGQEARSQLSVPLCTHASPGCAQPGETQHGVLWAGRTPPLLRQQGTKRVAAVTPATAQLDPAVAAMPGPPCGFPSGHPPAPGGYLGTCQKTRQQCLPKSLTETPYIFRTRVLTWN